ncbi:MAG TPA: DUF6112 family protein [Candidatus Dormibacteraeota bacterium]|nr:DUF6112 family protein [Candidatus Dormibacteraeota bacterium]
MIRLICVVGYSFDINQVPAHGVIQNLINGGAVLVGIACLAGFLISVAAWAIGSRAGNLGAAEFGRSGVVVALGAGLLLGLAPYLVNWAISTGQGVGTGC